MLQMQSCFRENGRTGRMGRTTRRRWDAAKRNGVDIRLEKIDGREKVQGIASPT
jgi:hypothetical protein